MNFNNGKTARTPVDVLATSPAVAGQQRQRQRADVVVQLQEEAAAPALQTLRAISKRNTEMLSNFRIRSYVVASVTHSMPFHHKIWVTKVAVGGWNAPCADTVGSNPRID